MSRDVLKAGDKKAKMYKVRGDERKSGKHTELANQERRCKPSEVRNVKSEQPILKLVPIYNVRPLDVLTDATIADSP